MTTLGKKPDFSLYSNAFGFLRQSLDFDPVNSDAEWIVTGVPFDLATTGRSGSRFGPEAIRKASVNLAWESPRWPWGFRLGDYLSIADCGDLVFEAGNASDLCESLQLHAEAILAEGKKMLTLGGDHFITLPLLRAHARQFGPLSLIHFDAHTDDYDEGGPFDHGTMFYHAVQEGLINPESSVQIGIRTHHDQENTPFQVFDAGYVNEASVTEIIDRIHMAVAHRPAYLTFDIDCLDPAYAPGTGTPVCGGLTSDRALQLVRGLQGLDIVGMDVVEVAPAYDSSDITALAAATVALDMLYIQAARKIDC